MKKVTFAHSTLYTSLLSLLVLTACSSNNDGSQTASTDNIPEHVHQDQKDTISDDQSNDIASTPKPQPKLTSSERFKGVLQAHNGVRLKHGLKPLTWSKKLADYSQQWADQLGQGNRCQIKHRGGNPSYGENLYRASALEWSDGRREVLPITIQNVVKSWTDEEKWYNYRSNSCQSGQKCGHYTQIVWEKTTEVGCAIKICPDKSQTWVCSYNPPGNFQGMRPY